MENIIIGFCMGALLFWAFRIDKINEKKKENGDTD